MADYFIARPPILQFVLDEFPFPIAITYARLEQEMDRNEPIAAVWTLRDAYEAVVKFLASLAAADMLATPGAECVDLIRTLFEQPMGVGHWYSLLRTALLTLKPFASAGKLEQSGRKFPELYNVLYTDRGKPTEHARYIDGNADAFIAWRNAGIGHGIFKVDRQEYANDVITHLQHLQELYTALRPLLDGGHLAGETPDGEIIWSGVAAMKRTERHEHVAWGKPTPMRFQRPGERGRSIEFGPLLSIQICEMCGQPAAFFFDSHDKSKTKFLEYHWAQVSRHPGLVDVLALRNRLPPDFQFRYFTYETGAIKQTIAGLFRDWNDECQRPQYLFNAVTEALKQDRKYLHVVGPEGIGKSYLVQAFAQYYDEATVLAYHIAPGAGAHYQTFIDQLHRTVNDKLGIGGAQPQLNQNSHPELQSSFVEYLRTVKLARPNATILIAIDGLDELPEVAAGGVNAATIIDLLPDADALPEGIHILLTGRETLRPQIQKGIDRLRLSGGEQFTSLRIAPHDADNRALLRAYLERHLPEPLRNEAAIAQVIEAAGGVFLYTYHLTRALRMGAFTDVTALPRGDEFYPAYLDRLREQVGETPFESAFLPTLMLLCAARIPVTWEQLENWGMRARLEETLPNLRDFLRVHRRPRWADTLSDDDTEYRYELAHAAFLRHVEGDPDLSERLRKAHATLAETAISAHAGDWQQAELTADVLYDLRFLQIHLAQAGLQSRVDEIDVNEDYGYACARAGERAIDRSRRQLGLDLMTVANGVLARLAASDPGNAEWQRDLSISHNQLGDLAVAQGDLSGALQHFTEDLAIAERLAASDPGNAEWQRDLSISHEKLGNLAVAQGDLSGALQRFTDCLIIAERLAASDPGNSEWQRDLSISHNKLGDLAVAQGDLSGALQRFTDSMTIFERLAASDPGNAEWQRDLSISHEKLGNLAVAQGDLSGALQRFTDSMTIFERLAASDPGNAEWQRDLSISHEKLGNLAVAQGDLSGALQRFTDCLIIAERLAASDPGNSEWQRDLSISHNKLGDLAVAQGDLSGALQRFKDCLTIRERLAASDPGNAQWQRDLSISHEKLGNLAVAQGDLSGALQHFTEDLAIAERLAASDPGNAEWQRDLSVSHNKLGDLAVAQGDLSGALQRFTDSLIIRERLAASDPGNAVWQRDLWVSYWRLADLTEQQGGEGAGQYWRNALVTIQGMKTNRMHLSPQDESALQYIREKAGR